MLSYCVFGILLSLDILVVTHVVGEWSYGANDTFGPKNWDKVNANCGKLKQSPIDIKGAEYDKSATTPVFSALYTEILEGTNFTLKNTGSTIKVDISISSGHTKQNVTMFGKTWIPKQFHWHWGPDDTKGSEHTVDGKMYPLEVHLIHINSKYFPSLDTALANQDGLLVMGTFYEIGSPNDAVITEVVANISSVQYKGENKTLSPFSYAKLMPSSKDFYHYNGSLTTPNCTEVVSWVVYKNTLNVTSAAMAKFRNFYQEKRGANTTTPISINYRPVQNLNGRKIFKNFGGSEERGANTTTPTVINFTNATAPPTDGGSGAGQSLPTSLFYYILPAFLYVFMN